MLTESAFKPAWWLQNCHLQTCYQTLFRKLPNPPEYWRERITTWDDDFIDIDFCGMEKRALVMLLHGLTGSSKSDYVKGLQRVLWRQGISSAAINFRGCSGQINDRARSYHSGETEDIHYIYQILRQREPDLPIAAVGFSLGGNVLLKWLGEQGNKLNLFAAVAVSVPLLLAICADKLDYGLSKLYRENLLKELKTYMHVKRHHLESIGRFDEMEKVKTLGDLSKIHSFWEYDDRVVAKLHGFKDVHDYYQRASSRQYLSAITVPTLVIQALDDPFMTSHVIPTQDELSPMVLLEVSQKGGHVGYIAGSSVCKPHYWLEHRIPEFLLAHR